MKTAKRFLSWLLAAGMLMGSWALGEEELPPEEEDLAAREAVEMMVQDAKEAYFSDPDVAATFAAGIKVSEEELPDGYGGSGTYEVHTLTYQGHSMRFLMETIGEPDDEGMYPLYITLHGGGGGPADENDGQWTAMFNYYKESVESGIYVACRGISDTWNLHFQEASYLLYDRLIAYLIYAEYADPNRVYLLGFSAGGDGVYQIAPRMADRFAAANMSSGHPNGVSLMNLANLPISLQAGIRDYYSESAMRSVRAAEFEKVLQDYREASGFGYEHRIWIHVPEGHNYNDYSDTDGQVLADPAAFAEKAEAENYLESFLEIFRETTGGDGVASLSYYPQEMSESFNARLTDFVSEGLEIEGVNTNAIRFVDQYTRNPAPEKLVWDLSTRAPSREVTSFYWLDADPSVNQGMFYAAFDRETNFYLIVPDDAVNGDFYILISPKLADLSRPVIFQTPKGNFVREMDASEELTIQCIQQTGDPELACVAMIAYSELEED